MSKITLAYWDIRCLVEPIKLILEYSQVEYDFKAYPTGDAPDYCRKEWKTDKFALDLDFPNLPYLIDGEVRLTESWAIMKYLGRKYNLFPQTEEEMQRCDVAQGVVEDFRYKFINFSYYATDATFNKLKTAFGATFKAYIDRFEAYLTKHKWLAGDTLTYVDFGLFEAMDQIRVFDSKLFNDHPKVIRYLKEINDLKGVSEYRSSDRFHVFPINSKYAYWGGQSS